MVIIIGGLAIYNIFFKSVLIELSVDEVVEKINNKDSFVLCISQTTCTHCKSFKPKLETVSEKYEVDIYYIDIDKYDEDEISLFKKNVSFDGSTPVTAFIVDGEEASASNRLFGDVKIDKIVKKMKNFGFIEE